MGEVCLAMRGQMGDNEYYVTTIKAYKLIQSVGYASEMENWPDMTVDERMQRELKGERIAQEIVPYLATDPDWLFGALIVDIYSGWEYAKFQPLTEVADVKYDVYSDAMRQAGFLTLPDDKRLIALDGQHRLAALAMAIRGKNGIPGSVDLSDALKATLVNAHPDIGNADITVMFIKHGDDNTKIRKIFNKVNRYAKQTSKGDNIITSEDDMVAIIARRMFSGEDAPLHPIGDQEVVNWKSNTIPLRSKNLTTLSAIYTMTEILLAKEGITPKTRRNEEMLEKGRIIMRDFWKESMSRIDIFKTYSEYVEKNISLGDVRKDHLLLKPVTHTALAQAVAIAKDYGHVYTDLIDKINKINWSQDNPVWGNILVTNSMNKRMITGSQALKDAGKIIAYMMIGNEFSAKEVDEVRDILKKAKADVKMKMVALLRKLRLRCRRLLNEGRDLYMDTDVNNRLYASCSSCGHVLGRALSGSDNEVRCPKCGTKINYKVAESIVTVTLLEPSTKLPSKKAEKEHLKAYNNLANAVSP